MYCTNHTKAMFTSVTKIKKMTCEQSFLPERYHSGKKDCDKGIVTKYNV